MKRVILKKIQLKNWKGLNLTVDFFENGNIISARNGKGKTSIQSAWNWLLCGYTNAYSPKNHELFDNRCELTHETPIASVKSWLSIDGIDYTLEKTAEAKFSRKRGTNTWEKDCSDVYKTYVDEIETSATNYIAWIDGNICDSTMLPYCLDGTFFSTVADVDKKRARKVLESIIGEITEKDFKGDYSMLANDFKKGYTIEQIEEKTKNAIKPLKKQQSETPAIIESKESMLATLLSFDYDTIVATAESKRKQIEDIDNALVGSAEAIQPILGKRDAIYETINAKTLELNERRNAYLADFKAKISQINTQINALKFERFAMQNDIKVKEESIATAKRVKETYEKMRLELVEKKNKIKEAVFTGDKCSFCGQDLPIEDVEKALNQFNMKKEHQLTTIVEEGKKLRTKIDSLSDDIAKREEELSKAMEKLAASNTPDILIDTRTEMENSFVAYEETDEYKALKKELDDLNASLPEIPTNDTDELTNAKNVLLNELSDLNRTLGKKDLADETKNEIAELKSLYRELGNQIAELEGVLAKCAEYNQERADIISTRVNGKLNGCNICMWETQKNGGLVPSCVIVSEDGVKFSTLNNSHRIKANVSIQKMFCEHFGINMPIFIDEASIFDTKNRPVYDGTQSVYLYASDNETIKAEEMK